VRRLRFALLGATIAYFFDPDNGSKRRKAAIKRLAELRGAKDSQGSPELSDDLAAAAPK
jgi:hypothetical protein